MDQPVQAVTDAATVYAAARFIANEYDDTSPTGVSYQSRLYDEVLYYELMNNIVLYDNLIYDSSSLEDSIAVEVKPLFDRINFECKCTLMQTDQIASHKSNELRWIRTGLATLFWDLVQSNPDKIQHLEKIPVPWAYKSEHHVDFEIFNNILSQANADSLVPLAVFVWRGLCYSAVAEYRRQVNNQPFAYVAAPGRIKALEAIISVDEMRDIRYPRESWINLANMIPELPKNGFEFTRLSSLPPIFRSNLTAKLRSLPQEAHLTYVAERRRSSEYCRLREQWGTMLFNKRDTCTIGNQVFQIIQDVTVHGDLTQTILATAAE